MSNAYFCDICSTIVARTGATQAAFIGVGDTVVNSCIECQTAVLELLAERQERLIKRDINFEVIPNVDFAQRKKEYKEAQDAKLVDQSN